MLSDELEKLARLRDSGVLTDQEFETRKQQMLATAPPAVTSEAPLAKDGYDGVYCSSDQKIVLGLCGGLAHKLGVPVLVVRVAVFVSLWFVVGWLYFLGLFLPKLPTQNVPRRA